MRKVVWTLVVLLWAAPLWAQQAVMDAVDAQYPHLLRANTHATDAEFLYRAVQALGPSWRLLSKSGGENGFTWPNGVRTSHDAICQVNGTEQKVQCVDVITAAGSGSPTHPSWGDIPPSNWRPSNLPVKLSDVPAPGGTAPPTNPPPANPPTNPAPVVNLQPVLDQIAALKAQIEALRAFIETVKGDVAVAGQKADDARSASVDAKNAAGDAIGRIDRAHQDVLVVIDQNKQPLRCVGRTPAFGGTVTLTCQP